MIRRLTMWLIALACFAQDPYVVLPRNYRVELENEFVRISRVRYTAHEKLPEHSHPARPTVYVYLNDGGPIRFTHIKPKFTVERPAVKAGGVRFNRNAKVETHEVEYLGESTTEYLRIELKTKPGPPHRDARLRTEADFPWEDDQVRISRPAAGAPLSHRPAVLVDISNRRFTWIAPAAHAPSKTAGAASVLIELKSAL